MYQATIKTLSIEIHVFTFNLFDVSVTTETNFKIHYTLSVGYNAKVVEAVAI